MCFNVDLLLKAKDCDGVFVQNNPINLIDPDGLNPVALNLVKKALQKVHKLVVVHCRRENLANLEARSVVHLRKGIV